MSQTPQLLHATCNVPHEAQLPHLRWLCVLNYFYFRGIPPAAAAATYSNYTTLRAKPYSAVAHLALFTSDDYNATHSNTTKESHRVTQNNWRW